MSLLFIILGAVSFIFVGVSVIISLLSTRYFVKGDIKKYLLFINTAFFFMIIPYALWYIQEMMMLNADPTFAIQPIGWLMSILIIISAIIFTAASIQLKHFSKVYGFKTPVSIKKKIESIRKKRG